MGYVLAALRAMFKPAHHHKWRVVEYPSGKIVVVCPDCGERREF